jgi:CRISPR/Cas system CMR-associated protein Cmr3 (group 5 of RAMP superfamily)
MNCYESDRLVEKFDLLIAEDTEFDLTRNRVYVVIDTQRGDLVVVKNDKGEEVEYSKEFFRFYDGETIDGFPVRK